ncbi:hypothetical protein, partial [Salmonella enterica]|uniref:hypothetical protein n=1 Tax=Salmonella enterica TaxID=28901 RepID=UPI003297AB0B
MEDRFIILTTFRLIFEDNSSTLELIRPSLKIIRPHLKIIQPHFQLIRPHLELFQPHPKLGQPHSGYVDHTSSHNKKTGTQSVPVNPL